MPHDWNTKPLAELFTTIEQDEHHPLDALLRAARHEDLDSAGDITSNTLVPESIYVTADLVARAPGRLAGLALIPHLLPIYDPALQLEESRRDGEALEAGSTIARITGHLRSILAAERVVLNFLTHLSGIATMTASFVDAVAGTNAKIYDTRKTIPGLRTLAKYAVRCGGGYCHRIGLFDAVLVKDNHIAHIPPRDLHDTLAAAIALARRSSPAPAFIEVEVDTLEQFRAILDLDIDIILLDNMTNDQMRQAVALRNDARPAAQLEASGGVNLDTVRAIAETGVDRIAIGALTHSAPALDIGLDISPPLLPENPDR